MNHSRRNCSSTISAVESINYGVISNNKSVFQEFVTTKTFGSTALSHFENENGTDAVLAYERDESMETADVSFNDG